MQCYNVNFYIILLILPLWIHQGLLPDSFSSGFFFFLAESGRVLRFGAGSQMLPLCPELVFTELLQPFLMMTFPCLWAMLYPPALEHHLD